MMHAALRESLVSSASAAESPIPAARGKKFPIGLELYSVREELKRDLPNTLRTVAKLGYEVVEFYAPYFAWTATYAKDVRRMMNDLGLRCFSTHNHIASFTPARPWITRSRSTRSRRASPHPCLAAARQRRIAGWKRICGQLSQGAEH